METEKPEILIVDDDSDIRDSIAIVLEQEGYRVTTAKDGVEAIDHLHAEGSPAVILLDMMMPGMNGWDFLEERAKEPAFASIPVVVMSASVNGEVALPGDPTMRLSKPFEIEQ